MILIILLVKINCYFKKEYSKKNWITQFNSYFCNVFRIHLHGYQPSVDTTVVKQYGQ